MFINHWCIGILMREIEEKRRAVEEVLRWYVDEYTRLSSINAPEEKFEELEKEIEERLSEYLDEVVWEVEACSMDRGNYFTVSTCGYYVGSIVQPPKVYDIVAMIRFATVEGRSSAHLIDVSVDERTLIDDELTPFAAALMDAIDWWRVRPTWQRKITEIIERIAEAEWTNNLNDVLKDVKAEVENAQWIYEFQHFHDVLLKTLDEFGIQLK